MGHPYGHQRQIEAEISFLSSLPTDDSTFYEDLDRRLLSYAMHHLNDYAATFGPWEIIQSRAINSSSMIFQPDKLMDMPAVASPLRPADREIYLEAHHYRAIIRISPWWTYSQIQSAIDEAVKDFPHIKASADEQARRDREREAHIRRVSQAPIDYDFQFTPPSPEQVREQRNSAYEREVFSDDSWRYKRYERQPRKLRGAPE